MILTWINSVILLAIVLGVLQKKIRKLKKKNKIALRNFGKYSYTSGSTLDSVISHPDTVIGKYTSIAGGCKIGPSEHPINFLSTHGFQYQKRFLGFANENNIYDVNDLTKPCIIGNDVWIGQDAIIKAGVKIGHGAIVGMGSIVTKDVAPYAIVVGNPAKIIRYRFDEATISRLLNSEWWNLPEQFLRTLPFDNVSKCLDLIENENLCQKLPDLHFLTEY